MTKLVHALRTDLTMYNFGDTPEVKKRSISSITRLLERVDTLMKCEQESVQDKDKTDLSLIVDRSIATLSEEARRRVKLTAIATPVRGNAALLQELVDEMLSNAIKFSAGDIYLSLHATGGHAVLRLEDFGVGLPKAIQRHIAEPFLRSDDDKSGHGLGLAIMWAIAQAHDGTLTVISDQGQGTTVLFCLDLV